RVHLVDRLERRLERSNPVAGAYQPRDEVADHRVGARHLALAGRNLEANRHEPLQIRDHVSRLGAAVDWPRLEDGVANLRIVAVGDDMVVRQDEALPGRPVPHDRAERPRCYLVVRDAYPARRRTPAVRTRLLCADHADLDDIRLIAVDARRHHLAGSQPGTWDFVPHQHNDAHLVGELALHLLQTNPDADNVWLLEDILFDSLLRHPQRAVLCHDPPSWPPSRVNLHHDT